MLFGKSWIVHLDLTPCSPGCVVTAAHTITHTYTHAYAHNTSLPNPPTHIYLAAFQYTMNKFDHTHIYYTGIHITIPTYNIHTTCTYTSNFNMHTYTHHAQACIDSYKGQT